LITGFSGELEEFPGMAAHPASRTMLMRARKAIEDFIGQAIKRLPHPVQQFLTGKQGSAPKSALVVNKRAFSFNRDLAKKWISARWSQ
jgi:hypothetical protein